MGQLANTVRADIEQKLAEAKAQLRPKLWRPDC